MAINATFESDFSNFIAGLARAEAALNKFADGTEKYTKQAKAAEQSTSVFSTAVSTATGLLGAFGITLTVEALFNFAKGAVDSAAALDDLSTATGISTDELQKMGYAGQGFGLSMETMSTAVQKLSADLASSSPNSAKSAVEALGLSVAALQAAGPEEAFLTISDAIARIEDPMLKNAVAAEVFGEKLSRTLNPSLGKMREEMEKVPTDALISPEVIQSANDFEAAIGRGVTRMEAWLLKAGQITGEMAKKVSTAMAATGGGPMDQTTFTAYLDQAAKMEAAATGIAEANETVTTSFAEWQGPINQAITKSDLLANTLQKLRADAFVSLTDTQKAAIDELLRYGKSHEEIARLVEGVTVPAIKLYIKAQADATDETKLAAAEMKKAWADLGAFRESADKRQIEIGKELAAAELARAGVINEQVVAELNARAKLNEAYGLDVDGHVKMTSALDTYTTKLDALHQKKQAGIDQYAQEELLMNEYTDDLKKEAEAVDKATQAFWNAREAVKKKSEAVEDATKKTGVYMNQLHMLVNDPKLAAFFGGNPVATTLYSGGHGGLTPEEAASMAAGIFINAAVGGEKFWGTSGRWGGGGYPGRAAGGPVSAGSPYLVGEQGPELFVPGASGTILGALERQRAVALAEARQRGVTIEGQETTQQIYQKLAAVERKLEHAVITSPATSALGATTITNTFYVNGTAEDVARQVADILNRQVMQGRKLSGS